MFEESKPKSSALRKGRFSQTGGIYHVVITTAGRQAIFTQLAPARKAILALKTSDELQRTHTLAFTLMPDHLHWLFNLGQDTELSKTIAAYKTFSARAIGKPIWQRGYYDHALRQEEDVQTLARYIVANPQRAGLVDKIKDYPHWDAVWL
jgi:putative transposase